MKRETKIILAILEHYLEKNPTIRFGQALANLNINMFANVESPEKALYNLKDIHNDTDEEILKRINI